MTIYCAKCEAENTDKAPFCGACGHPLIALAPAGRAGEPTLEAGDPSTTRIELTCDGCGASYSVYASDAGKVARCKRCGTGVLVPGVAPPKTQTLAAQFYELVHVIVALWAIGLCVLGCVPVMNGAQPHLAPYLPAGLMVLLFYAFRDYYHRWERHQKQQRRE